MQDIERIPTLEPRKPIDLLRVLLETVIALVGALLVTGIIYSFHLYPLIPDISFLYLLVVLGLASSFGLYAAIVASLTAFLSFDYFLVPPLYVFTINRWQEWVALFLFLLTAILTSQLMVALRERTALARRRERESKILYELIRLANSQELFEEQLAIVVESIVRVFAAWGARDCALLLPGAGETLTLAAQATTDSTEIVLSQEEQSMAVTAFTQGRMMEERVAPPPDSRDNVNHIIYYSTIGSVTTLRFIPLKTADQVLGVLALHLQHPVPWFTTMKRMRQEQTRSDSRIDFFWTFLEQATSILERARLRSSVASSTEER